MNAPQIRRALAIFAAAASLTACEREPPPLEPYTPPPSPSAATTNPPPATARPAPSPRPPATANPAPHPPATAPAPRPAPRQAMDPRLVEAAGLRMSAPEGWVRERPRSQMRLAQFRLPRAQGDAADGVLTLSTASGGAEANIQRWKGQFDGAPAAEAAARKVGDLDVTTVRIAGTYLIKARPMAPGPGTPHPDYVLLGAIIDTGTQPQVFLKAWGPRKTMDRWRAGFDQLVGSLQRAP